MQKNTKDFLKRFTPKRVIQIYRSSLLNNKYLKQRKLLSFEVSLADHCNLSCKSCNHFSPIAKEKFLNTDIFQRDCQRIAELSDGKLEKIRFMGGEPLLHQNIIDILNIGSKYFPNAAFTIATNGILLLKQTDEFWKTCHQNNTQIEISNYPVNLNRKEINRLSAQHQVKMIWLNQYTKAEWWSIKLDLTGCQDNKNSFKLCRMSNNTTNLYESKLYPCPTIAHAQHLNHYFNEHFVVTEDDYIDIYKAKSINEILDFLCKPVPFCRYCNIKNKNIIKWGHSKKERKEWIDE